MKWGKKPKVDPATTPTDPDAGNDPAPSKTKARRQLPSIRLPFGLTTVAYVLGGVVVVGELGIIAACLAAPAMVTNVVYATLGAGGLAGITAIAATATES